MPPSAPQPASAAIRGHLAGLSDHVRRRLGRGGDLHRLVERVIRGATTTARQRPVIAAAAAMTVLAVATSGLVVVSGRSEEFVALVGDRVLGVPPLPAIGEPHERSQVLDAQGNHLGTITGPENRTVVALDEIPQVLQDAVVATEDARFFEHDGIDTAGILRAGLANLRSGAVEQGGSSITQQYVKNALLSPERSLGRKITEATWAVRLEDRLTKDEILERYLNVVYLGDGAYGVGAASEYWFGRDVSRIDLPRAALLAAMIQAPAGLDPTSNPDAAQQARDVVLRQMRQHGFITESEREGAVSTTVADLLDVTPLPAPTQPMFVRHVLEELLDEPALAPTPEERRNLLFRGGLTITTTLDPDLQQKAVAAIASIVADPAEDPMAGLVTVTPGDGAVRAMALGPAAWGPCDPDREDQPCTSTTVNPLVPGMGSPGRQVGSAFKPIVVAAALEQGLGSDWQTRSVSGQELGADECPDYAPTNYDENDGGLLDMTSALLRSDNVFHVKLGIAAGLQNVVDTAASLGLDGVPPYCSISLGSIESYPVTMAGAYATFAADGLHCEPYVAAEVRDRHGELLVRHEPDCHRAVSEETARTVTALLEQNAQRGTARLARIDRPIAAKTGTTNDFRDAWLVGFTPQSATASWIGFEQPRPMEGILGFRRVAGGTAPAQLWAAFMGPATEDLDIVEFAPVELRQGRTCSGDIDSFRDGRQSCRRRSEPSGSTAPSDGATPLPTAEPSADATGEPSPSPDPTATPSQDPTTDPSPDPSPEPTDDPSSEPDDEASPTPTEEPDPEPDPEPTPEPSPSRSDEPDEGSGGGT